MIILGLDIATVTGFAWYEPHAPLSSIKTGIIKAAGENAEEKAASIAVQIVELFKDPITQKLRKPDFVAIEQPMRNVKTFAKKTQDMAGQVEEMTVNPNALQLSSLSGAAVAIVAAYRIPWVTIPSASWRKHFLGMGRSPGFDRAAWKRAAVDRCRTFKIEVRNADAAEAVGIAMAAEATQQFKMMKATAA
jgi:Holliday junction resolvasome RuvABC endonuclease subunit